MKSCFRFAIMFSLCHNRLVERTGRLSVDQDLLLSGTTLIQTIEQLRPAVHIQSTAVMDISDQIKLNFDPPDTFL